MLLMKQLRSPSTKQDSAQDQYQDLTMAAKNVQMRTKVIKKGMEKGRNR